MVGVVAVVGVPVVGVQVLQCHGVAWWLSVVVVDVGGGCHWARLVRTCATPRHAPALVVVQFSVQASHEAPPLGLVPRFSSVGSSHPCFCWSFAPEYSQSQPSLQGDLILHLWPHPRLSLSSDFVSESQSSQLLSHCRYLHLLEEVYIWMCDFGVLEIKQRDSSPVETVSSILTQPSKTSVVASSRFPCTTLARLMSLPS